MILYGLNEIVRVIKADPFATLYYLITHDKMKVSIYGVKRLIMSIAPDKFVQEFKDNKELMDIVRRGEKYGGIPYYAACALYTIVRSTNPEVCVETGVCSGVSSSCILLAMERNGLGRLYSIDMPNFDNGSTLTPGKESGFLIPNRLKRRWCLITGLSREKLKVLLDDIGKIDLFMHDSEHTYENMMFEFRTAWIYLKDKGLLLAHNVSWNDAFLDFCKKVDRKITMIFGTGAIRK